MYVHVGREPNGPIIFTNCQAPGTSRTDFKLQDLDLHASADITRSQANFKSHQVPIRFLADRYFLNKLLPTIRLDQSFSPS